MSLIPKTLTKTAHTELLESLKHLRKAKSLCRSYDWKNLIDQHISSIELAIVSTGGIDYLSSKELKHVEKAFPKIFKTFI